MKKIVLLAFATVVSISSLFAQDENCYEKLENAFLERGAYTVSDDIHRNVIISFFEEDEVYCVKAKVRVENGFITSIFYYFDDNTSELYDKKFYNDKKQPPSIENGISEMITNVDGESFKVIFIEKLKPKKKNLKRVEIPDDL
tara:strand:- start:69 stop:497 length:429 start_codon:yes stop_codon:yes gene_type:complete